MTWADNLSNDSEIEAYFVRGSARIKFASSAFTNVTGNIYSVPLDYGPVSNFAVNGVDKILYVGAAPTTTLPSGYYYYDKTNKVLYINTGGALGSTVAYIATFYLFFASQDCLWYQSPDDSTTDVVQWTGLLKTAPSYKMTIPPLALGYFPIEATSLEILNDGSLNYVLGNASFNRTACDVWQQLGSRKTANIQKSLTGLFGQRIHGTKDTITFDVTDKSATFDKSITGAYYSGTTVDPKYQGLPMLHLLGADTDPSDANSLGPLFEMVNIDYNDSAPSTSNNRKFGLIYSGNLNWCLETISTASILASTVYVKLTTLEEYQGFRVGDLVWWDDDAGSGSDVYGTISLLNNGAIYGHIACGFPSTGSLRTGKLRACPFGRVYIIKNGTTPYTLKYGRDYTFTDHANGAGGITLTSTAETNVGCATFDPTTDQIWTAGVSGRADALANAGSTFWGGEDSNAVFHPGGAAKPGIYMLYQFAEQFLGLSESQIDFSSITDALAYVDWNLYLPMPIAQQSDYPTARAALDMLLKSLLCRAYFSPSGVFTVKAYRPITTTLETIEKEQVATFEFDIDYSNLLKIAMVAAWDASAVFRLAYSGTKADFLAGTAKLTVVTTRGNYGVSDATSSSAGLYLHIIDAAQQFEHLAISSSNLTNLQSRLQDLLGERACLVQVSGKRLALQRNPGDHVTLKRDSLPGSAESVGNSGNFELLDVDKAEGSTKLTLSDNKAANDNSGNSYWP